MNFRLTCAFALGISFSAAAAESTDELIRTAPPAGRDTMLLCNAELLSGKTATQLSGKAYLEGVGEQILFAIIPTTKSDEYMQAFFSAWGFTPFGQVESREQFHNWALIHLGRQNLVRGKTSDYTFVNATPKDNIDFQMRDILRFYDCQNQNARPDWTRQESATQKHFNGNVY
ncbi:hypothetical protein AB6V48_19970 [Enterobacter hormaechei]